MFGGSRIPSKGKSEEKRTNPEQKKKLEGRKNWGSQGRERQ
jgi:hypothetical protein